MPYDTGVRQYLTSKGVNPSDISYVNGAVTLKGQTFMKPSKNYAGTTYDSKQNLDNAWSAYSSNKVNSWRGVPGTNAGNPAVNAVDAIKAKMPAQTPAAAPTYNDQVKSAIDALMNYKPQTTDPYQTDAYRAYAAQSDNRAHDGIRAAQEALGASGFGRSTQLGERAQRIQNQETEYLNTQIIPQIMAQEQAKQAQDYQNKVAMVNLLMQKQGQDEQLGIQKAGLTGYYNSPEMQGLYDEVTKAKQAYALATTPEERAAAHKRADDARAALAGMNANAGLVGSNVTLDQALANQSKYGVETMDHQQQMYNQSPDNPANQAQIISNKIDQLKLDNLPQQMKLELEQLQQQVKSGKIDLQTAQHNLDELTNPNSVTNKTKALQLQMTQIDASNYSQEAKLKLEQLQKTVDQIGKEPAVSDYEKQMQDIDLQKAQLELKNLQTGQPDKPLLATDFIPIINDLPYLQDETNENGDKTGRKIVNNPDGLKSYILSLGLSDAETIKLYTAYGLPLPKGATMGK